MAETPFGVEFMQWIESCGWQVTEVTMDFLTNKAGARQDKKQHRTQSESRPWQKSRARAWLAPASLYPRHASQDTQEAVVDRACPFCEGSLQLQAAMAAAQGRQRQLATGRLMLLKLNVAAAACLLSSSIYQTS